MRLLSGTGIYFKNAQWSWARVANTLNFCFCFHMHAARTWTKWTPNLLFPCRLFCNAYQHKLIVMYYRDTEIKIKILPIKKLIQDDFGRHTSYFWGFFVIPTSNQKLILGHDNFLPHSFQLIILLIYKSVRNVAEIHNILTPAPMEVQVQCVTDHRYYAYDYYGQKVNPFDLWNKT